MAVEAGAAEAALELLGRAAPEAARAVVEDLAGGPAWGAPPPTAALWPVLVRAAAQGGDWHRAVELTKVPLRPSPKH